jgi:hypothetical protein
MLESGVILPCLDAYAAKGNHMNPLIRAILVLACFLLAAACDRQGRPIQEFGLDRLTKGVSTEGEVRIVMGQPETVWEEENGVRRLEYPKGPMGLPVPGFS